MIDLHVSKKLHGVATNMTLHVDLHVKDNTFLALSGESGAGKTTLLRMIAGLEKGDGEIRVDDEVWQDKDRFLPPQKRKIGFVFQDYALFPNMSVLQNLLFIKKDMQKAEQLLGLSNLEKLKNRYPDTLSGGQKQRVALCRAMMNEPKILLLDEPLSALDHSMREKLQDEILKIHREFKTITIMVSHEPSEIYKLANEVVVLKNGVITQKGTPKEVLLQTKGSQKFSFSGEILEIKRVDVIFVAIIAIGQQIVEVVISQTEAKELHEGDRVAVSTKAFNPIVTKQG